MRRGLRTQNVRGFQKGHIASLQSVGLMVLNDNGFLLLETVYYDAIGGKYRIFLHLENGCFVEN